MMKKLTKLQWWNLGYDLNDNAIGQEEWNNRYCVFKVIRYTSDEVHPDKAARRKYLDHRNEVARTWRNKQSLHRWRFEQE